MERRRWRCLVGNTLFVCVCLLQQALHSNHLMSAFEWVKSFSISQFCRRAFDGRRRQRILVDCVPKPAQAHRSLSLCLSDKCWYPSLICLLALPSFNLLVTRDKHQNAEMQTFNAKFIFNPFTSALCASLAHTTVQRCVPKKENNERDMAYNIFESIIYKLGLRQKLCHLCQGNGYLIKIKR